MFLFLHPAMWQERSPAVYAKLIPGYGRTRSMDGGTSAIETLSAGHGKLISGCGRTWSMDGGTSSIETRSARMTNGGGDADWFCPEAHVALWYVRRVVASRGRRGSLAGAEVR